MRFTINHSPGYIQVKARGTMGGTNPNMKIDKSLNVLETNCRPMVGYRYMLHMSHTNKNRHQIRI